MEQARLDLLKDSTVKCLMRFGRIDSLDLANKLVGEIQPPFTADEALEGLLSLESEGLVRTCAPGPPQVFQLAGI